MSSLPFSPSSANVKIADQGLVAAILQNLFVNMLHLCLKKLQHFIALHNKITLMLIKYHSSVSKKHHIYVFL